MTVSAGSIARPVLAAVLAAALLGGCDQLNDGGRGQVADEIDSWTAKGIDDGVYADFKAQFPADFKAMRDRLAEKYAASGDMPKALRDARDQVAAFETAHRGDAARAPTDDLVSLFYADRTLLRLFAATDERSCARMTMGSLSGRIEVGELNDGLVTSDTKAMLHAIRNGIDHATTHPPFALGPSEKAALLARLKHDGVVLQKGALDDAGWEQQCTAGLALADLVLTLSPDRRAAFEASNLSSPIKKTP